MPEKLSVLLIGATGETGYDILTGLIEDGGFTIKAATRESSLGSPAVQKITALGVEVVAASETASAAELTPLLENIDVVLNAVGPTAQLDQIRWIDAAKLAGVKRFVPCGFTTICPRGGVMNIRDEKEVVHDHIFRERVPYTIVDVGYWYSISLFPVPSGRFDYAIVFPNLNIYGDGAAPNLLTDGPDIGRFVARIIRDPRTINKRVVVWGEELSQNQIRDTIERASREKLTLTPVSEQTTANNLAQAKQNLGDKPDFHQLVPVWMNEYIISKYFRVDNTLENAEYLGYLDGRQLYPDFKPKSFEDFVAEVLSGKGRRPYSGRI